MLKEVITKKVFRNLHKLRKWKQSKWEWHLDFDSRDLELEEISVIISLEHYLRHFSNLCHLYQIRVHRDLGINIIMNFPWNECRLLFQWGWWECKECTRACHALLHLHIRCCSRFHFQRRCSQNHPRVHWKFKSYTGCSFIIFPCIFSIEEKFPNNYFQKQSKGINSQEWEKCENTRFNSFSRYSMPRHTGSRIKFLLSRKNDSILKIYFSKIGYARYVEFYVDSKPENPFQLELIQSELYSKNDRPNIKEKSLKILPLH